MLDPEGWEYRLWRRLPFLPRWIAGTATTGLSHAYDRFCVASDGYRDHFVARGVPRDRIVVTGIPNFDDCRRFLRNDFPHRGYVLVCTSDARETAEARRPRAPSSARAVAIAAGRPLVFKLHPNENAERATRGDPRGWRPGRSSSRAGSAEEMIANCEVLDHPVLVHRRSSASRSARSVTRTGTSRSCAGCSGPERLRGAQRRRGLP